MTLGALDQKYLHREGVIWQLELFVVFRSVLIYRSKSDKKV